eukprot:ANDGO_02182.mRNA.1 hypothetical protein
MSGSSGDHHHHGAPTVVVSGSSAANANGLSPEDVRDRTRSFSARFHELTERNKRLEAEVDRIRKQRDECLEKLQRSRKRVEKTASDLEAQTRRSDDFAARLGAAEEELVKLRPQVAALEKENSLLRDQLSGSVDASVASLHEKIAELSGELAASLQKESMMHELFETAHIRQEEFDTLRSSWREAMEGESHVLDALESTQRDLELRFDECASLRSRLADSDRRIASVEQLLDEERDISQDWEEKTARLTKENASLSGLLQDRESQLAVVRGERDALAEHVRAMNSKTDWSERCVELELQVSNLQIENEQLSKRVQALVGSRIASGEVPLSEDVLERLSRILLLHHTLDEELGDMMLSYGSMSPKKQKEVLDNQRRYRVATVPADLHSATAASHSRLMSFNDDLGSVIDNGSELDDEIDDNFSSYPVSPRSEYAITPRDHPQSRTHQRQSSVQRQNGSASHSEKRVTHARQSSVVVEHARVPDDED